MNDPLAPSQIAGSLPNPVASLSGPVPAVVAAGKWHLVTIVAGYVLATMSLLPLDDLTTWLTSKEVPARVVVEMWRTPVKLSRPSLPEAMVVIPYFVSLVILPSSWGALRVGDRSAVVRPVVLTQRTTRRTPDPATWPAPATGLESTLTASC
ncbi:MAG: hypothetical protein ACUVXJ_17255, partial [Phycisphaerae bacterium]